MDKKSSSSIIPDAFNKELNSEVSFRSYKRKHQEFLEAENAAAWDQDAKDKANDLEKQAGAIIRAIREFERDVVFGNKAGEELPDKDSLDMGGQFLTNKDRIEQKSKIFKMAKKVPKGAILHLHFNAVLHPWRLLKEARKSQNMRIRSTKPIQNENDLNEAEIVLAVKPEAYISANIFSPKYAAKVPNAHKDSKKEQSLWMKYDAFLKGFDSRYGEMYAATAGNLPGPESRPDRTEGGLDFPRPVEEWLMGKIVISENEAYDASQTTNGYLYLITSKNVIC